MRWCGHLFGELLVADLSRGKDEQRGEGGNILQQCEEGTLHRVTYGLPPITDVWHVDYTWQAPLCFPKHLESNTYTHLSVTRTTNTGLSSTLELLLAPLMYDLSILTQMSPHQYNLKTSTFRNIFKTQNRD